MTITLESNINGYKVEEQIAESDSARVLRVRKGGQVFAMKIAKEGHAPQLLAEGVVQQRLSHHHIAHLIDLHRAPTYLLFELYPQTVRHKLRCPQHKRVGKARRNRRIPSTRTANRTRRLAIRYVLAGNHSLRTSHQPTADSAVYARIRTVQFTKRT